MDKFETLYYIIPWYGPAAGGAEYHAHLLCRTFLELGTRVEVLTTCGRDVAARWTKDAYPAGKTIIDGVPVRRFPLRKTDIRRFHDLNARILQGLLIGEQQAETFFQNSINSDELLSFIETHAADNAFLFMPYQYGTSVLGTRIAPERSFLIPCLHDEPGAYLPPVREMFRRVRGILFSTPPEAAFANRLYDLRDEHTETFGVGVHEDFSADAERFRKKFGIDVPYIICIGRKDPGKNVYYLVHLFNQYLRDTATDLHLVLIGPEKVSDIPAPVAGRVIDLGYVEEQDKRDATAGAAVLIQPSNRESFSMVVMEAWLAGTPVMVNGHCAVTRWLATRADGGLYFDSYYEFKEGLDMLMERAHPGRRLAARGKEFVTRNYRWDDIARRAIGYIRARL